MGSRPCLTKSQIVERGLAPIKLSIRSMIIAGALFKAVVFLFISLLNLVLRPYGGAYLALLTSLYPGYDFLSHAPGIIVSSTYSLVAGALDRLAPASVYKFF